MALEPHTLTVTSGLISPPEPLKTHGQSNYHASPVQGIHSVPTAAAAAATSAQTTSLYGSTEKQNIPAPPKTAGTSGKMTILFSSLPVPV